ncbi:hypothetical protein SUGI_0195590 [Cryptomeria japonica]|nr:hypothetical protein SUGI_0195590 [Cryptomeria japonica]
MREIEEGGEFSKFKNLIGNTRKGNPGSTGFVAIVRNEMRKLLAVVSRAMGVATNNEVEILALDEGLKLFVELKISSIRIKGDSRIMINNVMKSKFGNWKLRSWLPSISERLNNIPKYHITHIY